MIVLCALLVVMPPSSGTATSEVRARSAELGIADALGSGMDLHATRRSVVGDTGLTVTIVDASFDGVPLARPVARVLSRGGTPLLVVGGGPVPPLAPAGPVLSQDEALDRAGRLAIGRDAGPESAELVARPGPSQTRLTWRVDLPWNPSTLHNFVVDLDAKTGAVVVIHDDAHRALIRAFERNPVLDPVPGDFELNFLDVTDGQLSGPHYRAFNCVEPVAGQPACDPQQIAAADVDGNFLYDPPDLLAAPALEDEFAEASAYYHADKAHLWLTALGLVGSPCHEGGGAADLLVNYKLYDGSVALAVENAAYLGACEPMIVFGQGKEVDWSYDGDVVIHELAHGVIDERIGDGKRLGGTRARADAVLTDAGAINEAVADFVANVVTGDPLHGEYVSQYGDAMGRDASNDYRCPQAVVGEVHFDAEPFSGALWEAYDVLGDAFTPAVVDMLTMLPEDTSYEDAASILATLVEQELGPDAADTLRQILAERGLDECARVVAWDELDRDQLWLVPKSNPVLFAPMRPPPIQLRVDVPEDADTVTMTWDMEVRTPPMWDPLPDINLLLKHGAPITFSYEQDEDTIVVEADSDQHIPGLNGGEVRIDAAPGEALHIALFNLGVHTAVLSSFAVELTFEGDTGDSSSGTSSGSGSTTETATTSASAPGSDTDTTGCGCGARSPHGTPWLLPLALPAVARRRRRAGA